MGAIMLVPVDVVAVVRMPATVEMYELLLLCCRDTVEISGTIVGAVGIFLGLDTILIPVWQDSCRRK